MEKYLLIAYFPVLHQPLKADYCHGAFKVYELCIFSDSLLVMNKSMYFCYIYVDGYPRYFFEEVLNYEYGV